MQVHALLTVPLHLLEVSRSIRPICSTRKTATTIIRELNGGLSLDPIAVTDRHETAI